MIELRNLRKTYGHGPRAVRALDDVSISVPAGEIFGVVGRSGAGKSTLLRTVNVLERPDSGTVTLDGTLMTGLEGGALRQARRSVGMVFQHFNLLANRSIQQNVEFALEAARVPRGKRASQAAEMLDLVGLKDRGGAYPAQLSGGQKQRVGIARALAAKPRVLLSDEATSALDPETTESILDLIRSINRELKLTVLLITHEMDVVKRICDSAALMENGAIVEQGELVEVIRTPGSKLAAQLFPLAAPADDEGPTVIDITFAGGTADRPVIARLAREHELDVSILGATVERIAGTQAGRTRLALPVAGEAAAAVVADLRRQGLIVEYLKGGAA
ncbi:ATP-binding cassette domain-containing protein [Herbiconiux sp. CPCC 203407]|uniref:ATP-binding cassette domain-containing protein n=1 Tax=Herbiconiux oxytropis TaxID=2970915 RepID=A0AA41XHC3_9MICO|nr:ATP-binding cassette domain-containing protein [Herbiconiux oxytropis]MCS5722188.1 ATP-binding cassette domain-containing protein [Herbiconiux oxytropis]MCS5725770.1 ATP-binding cassette domain-containing protein [Herbiconiux oxytropis]